jgi:hypothetical protein
MNTTNPASSESPQAVPLTDRQYAVLLILITSLFFLWAPRFQLLDAREQQDAPHRCWNPLLREWILEFGE